MRKSALPITLALVALGLVPSAAGAQSLSPAKAKFPERAFVLTLPAGAHARPEQISVTENGGPVSDLRAEPVGADRRSRLGVVLAIDHSTSMRGDAIARAYDAAHAFVAERNKRQPLGLVTFAQESAVRLPLTTDEYRIGERIDNRPPANGGTHLYDGAMQAIALIRDADLPGGFVVVLSDGKDFGSENDLQAVATAARDANVRLYTVGLRTPDFDPDALRSLAESAGGTYSEASSPAALAGIYSALGAEISNAYVVQYKSRAEPTVRVDVRADVQGIGSASATYTSPRLAVAHAAGDGGGGWSSPLAVALAIIVIGGLFVLAILTAVRQRRKTARERVSEYVVPRDPSAGDDEVTVTGRLEASTARSLENSAWWKRFSEESDIAGFESPPARLLLNALAIGVGAGFLLALMAGSVLVFVVCLLGAPVGLWFYARNRADRQRRLFGEQLADHLAVVGSTLRAGHSFPSALDSVLEDAPEPTQREFARAVADEKLGAPLDVSLENVARRMKNRDLEHVAMLARLQREAGADAAEMLEGVVTTIRERQELRRMVRTLTAQGRLSRIILTGLPIVVLAGLTVNTSDYVDPLYNTDTGRALLALAAVLVVAGSLLIKRIVEFDI